jgi:hypothetical protein
MKVFPVSINLLTTGTVPLCNDFTLHRIIDLSLFWICNWNLPCYIMLCIYWLQAHLFSWVLNTLLIYLTFLELVEKEEECLFKLETQDNYWMNGGLFEEIMVDQKTIIIQKTKNSSNFLHIKFKMYPYYVWRIFQTITVQNIVIQFFTLSW